MSNPLVPDFGDSAPLGTPPEFSSGANRKLCIICSKGNLDMAYPGLILANAALGEGVEVHLFFTFWGFDMITKGRMENLQFSFVGNTAMHPPSELAGRKINAPKRLAMPQILGVIPGMTFAATKLMKQQLEALDVPPVPEFMDLLQASGANFWGCKMSADMMNLTLDDLHEGVKDIISATDFIEISEGAQLLFI